MSSYVEDELAAYRRAERVERETRERAAALERSTTEYADRVQREADVYAGRIQRDADVYAERVQREAQEQSDAIYNKVQSALSDAIVKADDAAAQLGSINDRLSYHLEALQRAVNISKQALHEAAASLKNKE
jgi:hypothetical protein